jgi:hypothetical protein
MTCSIAAAVQGLANGSTAAETLGKNARSEIAVDLRFQPVYRFVLKWDAVQPCAPTWHVQIRALQPHQGAGGLAIVQNTFKQPAILSLAPAGPLTPLYALREPSLVAAVL